MTAPGEPGPLGEEARLLVEAARDWAARTFPEEHVATGSAECRWCPVCRGVAALRDPEVADKVAGAVVAAAGALAVLLDAFTADRPPPAADPAPAAARPGPPAAAESADPAPHALHHDIPLD